VLRKDSSDMNEADRQIVAAACAAAPERRIVVTHGTSTMVETATAVAAAIHGQAGKVVVLTGALLPERFKDSDADFNVGTAVAATACCAPGVYIAMSGSVLPWNAVTRDDAGRFIQSTIVA
jgi:L-asparaginase